MGRGGSARFNLGTGSVSVVLPDEVGRGTSKGGSLLSPAFVYERGPATPIPALNKGTKPNFFLKKKKKKLLQVSSMSW